MAKKPKVTYSSIIGRNDPYPEGAVVYKEWNLSEEYYGPNEKKCILYTLEERKGNG